jgi:hypothetical protein
LEPTGRVDPLLCVWVHRREVGTGCGHDDVAIRVSVEVDQWAFLLEGRSRGRCDRVVASTRNGLGIKVVGRIPVLLTDWGERVSRSDADHDGMSGRPDGCDNFETQAYKEEERGMKRLRYSHIFFCVVFGGCCRDGG